MRSGGVLRVPNEGYSRIGFRSDQEDHRGTEHTQGKWSIHIGFICITFISFHAIRFKVYVAIISIRNANQWVRLACLASSSELRLIPTYNWISWWIPHNWHSRFVQTLSSRGERLGQVTRFRPIFLHIYRYATWYAAIGSSLHRGKSSIHISFWQGVGFQVGVKYWCM